MLPFVMEGNTDASMTRRPSIPWTRKDPGSTTAIGSAASPIEQVRVRDVVVAPGEPASLEVVRRPRTPLEQEPLQTDPRPVPPAEVRRDRDGLGARVLDVDLQVILEVLADARHVLHDVDPERLQVVRVADPRPLPGRRRVDRAAAQQDLAGLDPERRPSMAVLEARRPVPLVHEPLHERARD